KNLIHKDTKTKWNPKGFDKDGFDADGFDKSLIHKDTNTNYDPTGFDKNLIHKDTKTKWNPKGFDKDGFDADGFDKSLIHKDTNTNYDPAGFDKNSIHKDTNTKHDLSGFDKDGFDFIGYDKNGYDKNGEPKIPLKYAEDNLTMQEYSNDKCPVCGTLHKNIKKCIKCNWQFIYIVEEQTEEQITAYNERLKSSRIEYYKSLNLVQSKNKVIWTNEIKNFKAHSSNDSYEKVLQEYYEEQIIAELKKHEQSYIEHKFKEPDEFEKPETIKARKIKFDAMKIEYEEKFEKERKLYIFKQKNLILKNLFNTVFGSPKLKDVKYNAGPEYFDAIIYSDKFSFEHKIKIYIPIDIAREFKNDFNKIQIKYKFNVIDDAIISDNIDIEYNKVKIKTVIENQYKINLYSDFFYYSNFIEYLDYPSVDKFINRMKYLINMEHNQAYREFIETYYYAFENYLYVVQQYIDTRSTRSIYPKLKLLRDELKKDKQTVEKILLNNDKLNELYNSTANEVKIEVENIWDSNIESFKKVLSKQNEIFTLDKNIKERKEKERKEKERKAQLSKLIWKDPKSKLIWQKYEIKCLTWKEAFTYAENLNIKRYGGYDDWRVPTKNELKEISNISQYSNYVMMLWSRNPLNVEYAYYVASGNESSKTALKSSRKYVICVRG
ncbi:MAG: DUF1566 domain-containing protein, partial [Bacteroidota bacterium]|nr:DUF1566 domain-containing protein [Bacteroidota bacterium]